MTTARTKHSVLSRLQDLLFKYSNPALNSIIDIINNPHTSDRLSLYLFLLQEIPLTIKALNLQHQAQLYTQSYPIESKEQLLHLEEQINKQLSLISTKIQENYSDPNEILMPFYDRIQQLAFNNNYTTIMRHYEQIIHILITNVNNLSFSATKIRLPISCEIFLVNCNKKIIFFSTVIKPHLDELCTLLTKKSYWTISKEQADNIPRSIQVLESFTSDLKKTHFCNALLEARSRVTPWDAINQFLTHLKVIDPHLENELRNFIAPFYNIQAHAANHSDRNEDEFQEVDLNKTSASLAIIASDEYKKENKIDNEEKISCTSAIIKRMVSLSITPPANPTQTISQKKLLLTGYNDTSTSSPKIFGPPHSPPPTTIQKNNDSNLSFNPE